MKQSTKSYIFISFLIFMINNDLVWVNISRIESVIWNLSELFLSEKAVRSFYHYYHAVFSSSHDFFVYVISFVWVIFTTVIIVKELIRLVRFIMKKASKNH